MGNVITVTREFGSMGRLIARQVAERLNFKYYDRDIIELTAKEFRYNVEELAAFDGQRISAFAKMMYPLGLGNAAMQNQVFEMERSVIIDLANSEDCVIVGRCSDYILREINHKSMLNVFIYAPYEKRIQACGEELHLKEYDAKKYLEGVDRARHNLYKNQAGVNFHSTKYRHLMLDSSIMSHEECAKYIAELARAKFHI